MGGIEDFTPSMEPTAPESTSEKIEKLPPNERKYVELEAQLIEVTTMLASQIDHEDLDKLRNFDVSRINLSTNNTEQLLGKSSDQFSKEDGKKRNELRKLSDDLAISRTAEKVQKGIYDINDLPKGKGREEVEAFIGKKGSV